MDGDVSMLLVCMVTVLVLFFVARGIIVSGKSGAPIDGEEKEESATDFEAVLQRTKVYEILLPKGMVWLSERAKSFMDHMLTIFGGKVVFRILADPEKVVWQILDCRALLEDPSLVIQAIRSSYPEADVSVDDFGLSDESDEWYRAIAPYKLGVDFFAPLKSVNEITVDDPLAALVQSMADLREGERYIYTLYVGGFADKKTLDWGRKQIRIPAGREAYNFGLGALNLALSQGRSSFKPLSGTGRTGKGRYIEQEQKVFEHKLYDQLLVNAYLLLQKDVVGKDEESLDRMANEITILATRFASDYNLLEPFSPKGRTQPWWMDPSDPDSEMVNSTMGVIGRWIAGTDDHWKQIRLVLSVEELAALWHLPHKGFTANEIAWIPSGRVAAPAALVRNKEGVLLGKNVFTGEGVPIRILDEDRRTHVNIVGKTGVGKSTLMQNLVHQDIRDGKGVGVIDPHGKLVSDILRCSIPDDRIDDVVVIDIANEEHPPPLNPMIAPGKWDSMAAGQVVAVLDKIYGGILNTPRIADTLTAALVTLGRERTPTVRDVVKLFTDIEYRYRFLDTIDDVITLEFWEEFENQSPSMQRDLSYPILHRMRKFYGNPALYPMMCHSGALDIARFISERKIVLVSLGADEEKVPEPEQQLLGAVIVSQFQMAAMRSLEATTPFFLYIDEVQNFVTSSLNKVLDEARKFQLHMIMANQFLGQLRGKILGSVMGNIGATVVFQIGMDDAKVLAPYFKPEFSTEELVNLALFNAAVKMRFGGQTLPAFSLQTMQPPGDVESSEAKEREEMIRRRSVELHTPKTRDDVLAWLEERYPRPKFSKPIKGKDDQATEDWIVADD